MLEKHTSIHLIELLKFNNSNNNLSIRSNGKELFYLFSLFFKDENKVNINSEQLNFLINLTKYLFKNDKLQILMLLTELYSILLKREIKELKNCSLNTLFNEITSLYKSLKKPYIKTQLNYAILKLKCKFYESKNLTEIVFNIHTLLNDKFFRTREKQKNNILKYLKNFETSKKILKFQFNWKEFNHFIKTLNPIYSFCGNKIIKENVPKEEMHNIYKNLISYNFRISKLLFTLKEKVPSNQHIILDELIVFLYFLSGDYFNLKHFINKRITWYEQINNINAIQRFLFWQIIIENYAHKSFINVKDDFFKSGSTIRIISIPEVNKIINIQSIYKFYALKEKEINRFFNYENLNECNKIENIFFNTLFRQKIALELINQKIYNDYFIHLCNFITKKVPIKNFIEKIKEILINYAKNIYFVFKINDSTIKFLNLKTNDTIIIKSQLNDATTRFFSLLTLNRIKPVDWISEKRHIDLKILEFLNSWEFDTTFDQTDLLESVFLLHQDVYNIPIENFNIFKEKKIKRLNSLEFLLGKFDKFNTPPMNPKLNDILVIIDNSEDLKNTHIRIKDFLEKHKLTFYYSIDDVEKEIVLKSKTLIYFGHGNGKRKSKNLLNFKFHGINFPNMESIFLFGCSSLKMQYVDNFQHNFIINEYLQIFPNLRDVVGCLWDITDRDIDLLSKEIITNYIKGNTILNNLEINKKSMRMKGLNGASVVVFGF